MTTGLKLFVRCLTYGIGAGLVTVVKTRHRCRIRKRDTSGLRHELAGRKPRLSLRAVGSSLLRFAARTLRTVLFQLPPLYTRFVPVASPCLLGHLFNYCSPYACSAHHKRIGSGCPSDEAVRRVRRNVLRHFASVK